MPVHSLFVVSEKTSALLFSRYFYSFPGPELSSSLVSPLVYAKNISKSNNLTAFLSENKHPKQKHFGDNVNDEKISQLNCQDSRDPDMRNHEELGSVLGGYHCYTKLERTEFEHQIMLETNLYRKEILSTRKNQFTCINFQGQNIDIVYGIFGEFLIYICGIGAYDVLICKY